MTADLPEGAAPSVTVVIPVKDDDVRLQRCLAALAQSTVAPLEVLVLDNGSVSPDVAAVERTGARWISVPSGGSYAARNAGAAVARGTVLAFTDADCVPDPHWIAGGLAALAALPAGAVVGGEIVMFREDGRRAPTSAELHDLMFGLPQAFYVTHHRFAVTANLFVTTEAFLRSGCFDAKLFSGGDREWGQRMAADGAVVAFAAGAIVRHPARASISALATKARRTEEGAARVDRNAATPPRFLRRLIPPTRSLARRARRPPEPVRRNAIRAVSLEFALHLYKNIAYLRAMSQR